MTDPTRPSILGGSGCSDHAAGVWSASSRYAAVLVLLVCIFVVLSLTQENFFTRPNIENLLTSVSILFVVSMGMTFVVLTAGIDLSVGSTLALMGILLSHLFNNVGLPAWLAVLLTLVAGALLGGLVNGVLIGKVGLSFFVVTLGTLSLYQGIVNIWSGHGDDLHHVLVHRLVRVRQRARDPVADLDHARRRISSRSSSCAGRTSGATSTPSAATSRRRGSRGSTSRER